MHKFSTLVEGPVTIKEVGAEFINVILNKPKTLNSLDLEMIRSLQPYVKKWDKDSPVKVVLVEGAGDKAFCAGGDVKSLWEAKTKGDSSQQKILEDFFREEFTLDYSLTQMGPIQISLLDGIVMGGGVGISVHSPVRIATEASMFAMPEAKLGFFTDVGGGYFLSNLRKNLGYYIGLTGARLKGKELVQAGIANYYVPRDKIQELRHELKHSIIKDTDLEQINDIVTKFTEEVEPQFQYEDEIQQLFEGSNFTDVYNKISQDKSELGKKVFKMLNQQCPFSLRVIYEQINRAEQERYDLKKALISDYRLSQRFMQGEDFFEGVRTVLVDKNDTPKWKYSNPLDVPKEEIDSYFKPLTHVKELDI